MVNWSGVQKIRVLWNVSQLPETIIRDHCSHDFPHSSAAFWLDDLAKRREQGTNKEVKFVQDRKNWHVFIVVYFNYFAIFYKEKS